MEKLITLINKGWNIKVFNQIKRMDIDDVHRDFVVRVCWEATHNEKLLKCEWEGFENAEKAIEDLLLKVK